MTVAELGTPAPVAPETGAGVPDLTGVDPADVVATATLLVELERAISPSWPRPQRTAPAVARTALHPDPPASWSAAPISWGFGAAREVVARDLPTRQRSPPALRQERA